MGMFDRFTSDRTAAKPEPESEPTTFESLSPEGVLDSVYPHLLPAHALGPDAAANGPEWMPGVIQGSVVVLPSAVHILTREQLQSRAPGADVDSFAWRNLRAELAKGVQVGRFTQDDRWFGVIVGSPVHTASLALLMPELLAVTNPGEDLSRGVVFALPVRDQIAYRVVQGKDSILAALTEMPGYASAGFHQGQGPVSSHVYLWRDGQVTQLTQVGDNGAIQVHLGPHLEAILADAG